MVHYVGVDDEEKRGIGPCKKSTPFLSCPAHCTVITLSETQSLNKDMNTLLKKSRLDSVNCTARRLSK